MTAKRIPRAAPTGQIPEVSLAPLEWRLFELVDGQTPVDELAKRAGLGLDVADRQLAALERKGLVVTQVVDPEAVGSRGLPPLPPPPVEPGGRVLSPADEAPPVPVSSIEQPSAAAVADRTGRGAWFARAVAGTSADERPFRVVLVCTGNRFRSPIVAGLIRKLTAGVPVEIVSAGTEDVGPAPALPEALRVAERFGVDLSQHRAWPLSALDVTRADLVIGFERQHVAAAVVDAGASRERTFLAVELADLLDSLDLPTELDPIARARAAVEEAERRRPAGVAVRSGLQMRDPVGGPTSAYEHAADRLNALSTRLVRGLFGPGRAEPPITSLGVGRDAMPLPPGRRRPH